MDKKDLMSRIGLSKEPTKVHEALNRVDTINAQFKSGKTNRGIYSYDLFHDAYCNFVAQSQSGQTLTVQGVEMNLAYNHNYFPNREAKEDRCSTLNIGKYSITYYYNKDGIECVEGPKEGIPLTMIDLSNDTTIFEGNFGDISDEALSIIEMISKWSALYYDMYFDRTLLMEFKRAVEQGKLKGNDVLSITDGQRRFKWQPTWEWRRR